MSKIIEFDSENEFINYRKTKALKKVGEGSEGVCYLGKDGYVYKDLTDGFIPPELDVNKIITSDDVSVESFNFPNVLFAHNGCLIGHTSKFVSNDLFDDEMFYDYGIEHINFDTLINAYYKMLNDAEILADLNIKIFDLSYNVMFDGERLYGIDTDHYEKVDYPVLEHNKSCVNNALKDQFVMVAEYVFEDDLVDLARSMNTVDFLNYIVNMYSENDLSSVDDNIIQYSKKK